MDCQFSFAKPFSEDLFMISWSLQQVLFYGRRRPSLYQPSLIFIICIFTVYNLYYICLYYFKIKFVHLFIYLHVCCVPVLFFYVFLLALVTHEWQWMLLDTCEFSILDNFRRLWKKLTKFILSLQFKSCFIYVVKLLAVRVSVSFKLQFHVGHHCVQWLVHSLTNTVVTDFSPSKSLIPVQFWGPVNLVKWAAENSLGKSSWPAQYWPYLNIWSPKTWAWYQIIKMPKCHVNVFCLLLLLLAFFYLMWNLTFMKSAARGCITFCLMSLIAFFWFVWHGSFDRTSFRWISDVIYFSVLYFFPSILLKTITEIN